MAKSDEQKFAAMVRKNQAKAAKGKPKKAKFDPTLQTDTTTPEDLERQSFFSEMKKREF